MDDTTGTDGTGSSAGLDAFSVESVYAELLGRAPGSAGDHRGIGVGLGHQVAEGRQGRVGIVEADAEGLDR